MRSHPAAVWNGADRGCLEGVLASSMGSQQYAAMATSITIRNVPDEVRDELASRASLAGRSLQEHLRAELIELARRPSVESLVRQVRARKQAAGSQLDAERILANRDADRR